MNWEVGVRSVLVAAGLILPGGGWMRALRVPLPWLAGGLASALLILAGVMLLHAIAVPITLLSLAGWLAGAGVPGWIWFFRQRPETEPGAAAVRPAREAWLAAPALLLVAVACWRAVAQPLSGPDASFRWDLLAQLIVEQGSLGGYPPVSTGDFSRYFWADGINPLVSAVYAWSYLAGGDGDARWTALSNLLQVAALLGVLFGLGTQWGGTRGGWLACSLGGATMLLQFAFNLGQETGFTAIGVGGLVLYLLQWRKSRAVGDALAAATAASVAACAREYGAAAGIIGALWLLRHGRSGRVVALFVVTAAALPLWWHARVAVLTGNPVYAHALAGLPTNAVFARWMEGYRSTYGDVLRHAAGWCEILRLLAVSATPAVFGWLVAVSGWRRQASLGLVAMLSAAFAGLWLASVSSTAGGLFYSMRVLSPVLVLGCAGGGACLASWVPGRRHLAGVMAALTLLAADASLRALTIPENPYATPPSQWADAGYRLKLDFDRENRPFLRDVARLVSGRVLSDSAGLREFFAAEGKTYAPIWSPDAQWLFSGEAVPDAAARLRAQGYSHLLLKRSPLSIDFLRRGGVWASLEGSLRIVRENGTFVLIEIRDPTPPPASAP